MLFRSDFERTRARAASRAVPRQAVDFTAGAGALGEHRSKAVLQRYGIPVVRELLLTPPEVEALTALPLAFPVAVKLESPDLPHKTEAGGVELGIADPYELDEAQYGAALELLRGQRKIVSRYWHDPFIQIDDFVNEGVVASSSWPFMVNILVRQGKPIASTIPKEGATGWADTTMMHVDAPHPVCAQRWLEHSLDAKVQGDLAAWFGSVPVVPAACRDNPLLGEDGCARNGFENFEKIRFWRTPTSR